jgi:hypothetical protein
VVATRLAPGEERFDVGTSRLLRGVRQFASERLVPARPGGLLDGVERVRPRRAGGQPVDSYGGRAGVWCRSLPPAPGTPADEPRSDPPSALVDAAIARFGPAPAPCGGHRRARSASGGSSAIVTATVRALCAGRALAPEGG